MEWVGIFETGPFTLSLPNRHARLVWPLSPNEYFELKEARSRRRLQGRVGQAMAVPLAS
jgi:hypothetical protein